MQTHSTRLATLFCAFGGTALIAGCGGGSSGAAKDNRPTGGAGLNGISLANCLTDENWLVAPSQGSIEGLSPAGAPVTVKIFANAAEAKSAAGTAKNKRVAGRAVISFQEQATSSNTGDKAGKVDPADVKTVTTCVTRLDAA